MKKFRHFYRSIFTIGILLLGATCSYAQGIEDPGCDPLDPYCPIDDYYWVLILAIVSIAVFKAFRNKIVVANS